jgi:hypothetical protein
VVENDRESTSTFETANEKSWIDITLSRDARMEGWAVREEETLSEHRSISFSVDIGEMGNDQPKERKKIMMVHQADWQLFSDAAIKGKGAIFKKDTAEDMASALQGLAMRACKASLPCGIRKERKGNGWWNAKLRRIWAGVRKARSQMQRERNQKRRSGASRNLQIGEGSLQDGDQGGEDRGAPEGPVSGKSGGSVVSCVQTDHQQEEGSSNAVDDDPGQRGELGRKPDGNRDGTHPEDDPGADTAENRETRAKRPEWNDDQARQIIQQELRRIVREKPKKAPGIDGFLTAGLEHLLEAIGGDMLEVFNRCLKEGRFPRVWKQVEIDTKTRRFGAQTTIGKVYKILATRLTYHLKVKGTAIGQTVRIQKRQGDDRGNR